MSDENKQGSGCWKFVAFGCLGLLGLGAVTTLVLGAVVRNAFSGGGDKEWLAQSRDELRSNLEWRLDDASPASDGATDAEIAGVTTEEQLADAGAARALPIQRQAGEATGSLTLDLSRGSFRLVPFDGDRVEVVNGYDTGSNPGDFEFSHETTVEDDGSVHDVVRFRNKLNFNDHGRQQLIVKVPRDRPFALRGEVEQGESELDIGGTAVRTVDLAMGMGDHRLVVSEPTARPVDSVFVRGRMGSLRFEDLGNASPFEMDLSHRMGELRLDLDGLWRNDALLSMRCAMGECAARVPDGVRAEVSASAFMGGKRISVPSPEESGLPDESPLLHIRARVAMGEVSVR